MTWPATWPAHALLDINALWLLAPLPLEALGYDFGALAACVALDALLPDLDASEPKMKHQQLCGPTSGRSCCPRR